RRAAAMPATKADIHSGMRSRCGPAASRNTTVSQWMSRAPSGRELRLVGSGVMQCEGAQAIGAVRGAGVDRNHRSREAQAVSVAAGVRVDDPACQVFQLLLGIHLR